MLLFVLLACADVTSPENGARLGPVIQLQDWFTSCFLLEGGGEVVLFDACWRSARLEEALGEQGRGASDVTHVLLTHAHDDHVGALEVLPNAQVWALAAEAELVETATDDATALDRVLADGDSLSLANGIGIRCLTIPIEKSFAIFKEQMTPFFDGKPGGAVRRYVREV